MGKRIGNAEQGHENMPRYTLGRESSGLWTVAQVQGHVGRCYSHRDGDPTGVR